MTDTKQPQVRRLTVSQRDVIVSTFALIFNNTTSDGMILSLSLNALDLISIYKINEYLSNLEVLQDEGKEDYVVIPATTNFNVHLSKIIGITGEQAYLLGLLYGVIK